MTAWSNQSGPIVPKRWIRTSGPWFAVSVSLLGFLCVWCGFWAMEWCNGQPWESCRMSNRTHWLSSTRLLQSTNHQNRIARFLSMDFAFLSFLWNKLYYRETDLTLVDKLTDSRGKVAGSWLFALCANKSTFWTNNTQGTEDWCHWKWSFPKWSRSQTYCLVLWARLWCCPYFMLGIFIWGVARSCCCW